MTTITHRIGGSEPIVLQPEQEDGTMPDLTGSAMELRIGTGDACLKIPGTITADGYEVDLNGLDLAPRLHTASIWTDWGNGWRHQGDVFLNVTGGC